MTANQAAEFYGEQFDDAVSELDAAIRERDRTATREARKLALAIKRKAARCGVDVEYDGGWMVPSVEACKARLALCVDASPRQNGGAFTPFGSRA